MKDKKGAALAEWGWDPGALGLFPDPLPHMTLASPLTLASVYTFGQRDGNTLPGDCPGPLTVKLGAGPDVHGRFY